MKRSAPKSSRPANLPMKRLVEEISKIEDEIVPYRIQIRISKIVIKNPDEYRYDPQTRP